MEYFIATIIPLIIKGAYSDWFFNIFIINIALAIKNNLVLLLTIGYGWQRFSKYTSSDLDDKLSTKFVNWLQSKIGKKPKDEI